MEFEVILREKDEIIEALKIKNAPLTPLKQRNDVFNFYFNNFINLFTFSFKIL